MLLRGWGRTALQVGRAARPTARQRVVRFASSAAASSVASAGGLWLLGAGCGGAASADASSEWTAHADPASGRTYYHNERTGATTWTNPATPKPAQQVKAAAPSLLAPVEVAKGPEQVKSAPPQLAAAAEAAKAAAAAAAAAAGPSGAAAAEAAKAAAEAAASAAGGALKGVEGLDVNKDGKIDQADIEAAMAQAQDAVTAGFTEYAGGISFGSACGFASGYTVKKAGKVAVVGFGTIFMGLQGLASVGLIQINWHRAVEMFDSQLDLNDDGKIDKADAEIAIAKLQARLTLGMGPAAVGFPAGLALGLKYG